MEDRARRAEIGVSIVFKVKERKFILLEKNISDCNANCCHAVTQYTCSDTAAKYIKSRHFHAPGVAEFLFQVCAEIKKIGRVLR